MSFATILSTAGKLLGTTAKVAQVSIGATSSATDLLADRVDQLVETSNDKSAIRAKRRAERLLDLQAEVDNDTARSTILREEQSKQFAAETETLSLNLQLETAKTIRKNAALRARLASGDLSDPIAEPIIEPVVVADPAIVPPEVSQPSAEDFSGIIDNGSSFMPK